MSKIVKNLYKVKFRHTKNENEDKTEMNVIAVDMEEALKKASENKEIVMSGKDDPVIITGVELEVSIDVE